MVSKLHRSLPMTRRRFLVGWASTTVLVVLAACNVPTAAPPTPAPAQPTAPAAPKTAAPTTAPTTAATAPAQSTPAASPKAGTPAAASGSSIDWQRFKGATVHYIWTDAKQTISGMTPVWGEFEELTGIKLEYEGLGTNPARQKIGIALAAQDPSLDGFGMQVSQQGRQFFSNKWLEPLTPFLTDPSLTDASWDYEDFGEGALTASLIPDQDAEAGLTLTATAQCQVLYYRKDLFEQAGLQPPKTLEEMAQAAEALHRPDQQVYGVTLRGLGRDATTQIGTYMYGLGGKWVQDDGRLAIDTPEMLETLEFYGGLMHKFGPPGGTSITADQSAALFQQGQAAMMSELNTWMAILNDPAQSPNVAGKVGISYIPRGPVDGPVPGGHFIMLPVQNFAISPFSRNKEATWYFLQWLANKQNFLRRQLTGTPSPRQSTWSDPEFLETTTAKNNPDWIDVSLGGARYGRNWVSPPILAVNEFRDIFGKAIDAAVSGQPIGPALKAAQAECDALLQRTEPPDHKLLDWSELPS